MAWPEPVPVRPLDRAGLSEKYDQWLDRIVRNHGAGEHRVNASTAFAPPRPMTESTVALVSTAGVHLENQPPFHTSTVAGDAGHRVIPADVDPARLRFSHTHYDTTAAEEDSDVVLPIRALHDAVAAGRVGASAPVHIGMMGFNPDPGPIADQAGPAVAAALHEVGVDLAILVPG